MALISVLVPVYHVGKYLPECLDSIINQTLRDIEIICVNDGSTQEDLDILERCAKADGRIKIISKQNGGLPSARNTGIKAARGEYIAFADADDSMRPDMLEKLYKAAKRDGSEIVVCGANVFPREPKPQDWLDRVLSPENAYYPVGDEKLIFENSASRPFLWRTLISRELLTRTGFLLNEDIHVGEDNAFQLRIYPKARGITLISDKLYNYRWYREDSLMNSIVYKDARRKCLAHIKMVLYVAGEWIKSGDMRKMGRAFLQWSAEFLYDDFIRLPLADRAENAKRLTDIWTECGYGKYRYVFAPHVRDMFEYFYSMAKEEPLRCAVSLVLSADSENRSPEALEKAVQSCLEQSFRDFELIIVNHGVCAECYAVIHKYLHRDKRIRVYNAKEGHFTDGCNIAAGLAEGKYILFLFPFGELSGRDSLLKWMRRAEEEGADLTLPPEGSGGNALYRTGFIRKNGLEFRNYSVMSGSVFIEAARLAAEKTASAGEQVYTGAVRPAEKLTAKDLALMLRSVADRMELAKARGSAEAYGRAFALLKSGYFDRLVRECFERVYVPEYGCADTESPEETVRELMRILSLTDPDMLPEKDVKLPALFSGFTDGRHKYIGDLSDKFTGF